MSLLRTTVFLAACLCVTFAAPVDDIVAPAPLADNENYRLPLTIKPTNYNITLQPYLLETDGAKRFTFDGEVTIEIQPSERTRNLVMHTKNLNYTLREYWDKSLPNTKTNLNNFDFNNVTDKINYTLGEDLVPEKVYVLHFIFVGSMDDDMHGFYRSSYTDKKNVTKWLGSTQFQTNHARRAFPSFDEPKFKATFDITLIHHKSMRSVSNTRIIRSTLVGDNVIDVYATTPKMSTYILAFIVSEFNERYNGNFGVIARPEYYAQTEYAFDVGQQVLDELDDYLGIKYYTMGVDKMHMAAIPDFSAGAMENWGLLTYRERSLLYEEGSTSLSAKQSIAGVVAHEQAHMWFGDLVTCDWWSYAWLNEGFARYFQYFATAKVEKQFDMDLQFPVAQIQSVMSMDSTNNTNPMSDENTNSPADLSRMFNSITYNKGAAVIRMVKHILGEENFRKSLQDYLNKYKYESTTPQNLTDYWRAAWPQQFTSQFDGFFKTFTEQVGYPVITVNVANDARSFDISQKRFLLKSDDGSATDLLYTVPITYTTNSDKNFADTTPKLFLDTSSSKVTLSNNITWIIANIQETGYYRVNYDENNWHAIHHALFENNWSNIHELNRAQIVDDLLNLARAGVINYNLALEVLEYLSTETNYLPWTAAFNGYSNLAIRLGTETKKFGEYIRQLTEKSYKMLGFEERDSDGTLDIYNRANILSWSCKFGNSECISKAKTYFNNLKNTPVPVNIRSAVYCTAMREGNEQDFDTLFSKFQAETVATEETLILNSLGCVKHETLVAKYFNIIISDQVRRQDKSAALTSLYNENNENITPVFTLVTNNFDKLAEAMGGYSTVAGVISNIAARFTERSQQQQLETFNRDNKAKFGTSATTLENAEKTVANNLLWSENRLGEVINYLEMQRGGSANVNAFTMLTIVLVAVVAILFR